MVIIHNDIEVSIIVMIETVTIIYIHIYIYTLVDGLLGQCLQEAPGGLVDITIWPNHIGE